MLSLKATLKATPATSLASIISDDVRVALKASLCVDAVGGSCEAGDELVVTPPSSDMFRDERHWGCLPLFIGSPPDLCVVKIMVNYGGDE